MHLSDLHLLYDVFGGAILMQAASKAVLLNVGANVALFKDIGMRAAMEAERSELERISLERSEAVERAYAARMSDSEDFAGR